MLDESGKKLESHKKAGCIEPGNPEDCYKTSDCIETRKYPVNLQEMVSEAEAANYQNHSSSKGTQEQPGKHPEEANNLVMGSEAELMKLVEIINMLSGNKVEKQADELQNSSKTETKPDTDESNNSLKCNEADNKFEYVSTKATHNNSGKPSVPSKTPLLHQNSEKNLIASKLQ